VAVALLAGCDDSKLPKTPAPDKAAASATSSQPSAAVSVTPEAAQVAPPTGREAVTAPPTQVAAAPAKQGAAPTGTAAAATKSAAATGQLLKSSELKEKPFIDAKTVATLAAQAKVTLLERNGGWYRVTSGGKSGWVRMLNVKVIAGGESLGGSDLGQVASLATGRAGTGNVVSTSGLRGLNEEQLSEAKPDYGQLEKLDSYGVSKQAALDYAKKNGLQGRQLAYLPAVKR
jgi:hypothetical protein